MSIKSLDRLMMLKIEGHEFSDYDRALEVWCSTKSFRKEIQIAKMIGTVFGLLIVCWGLYAVMVNVSHARPSDDYQTKVTKTYIYELSLALLFSNSGMNPFVYAWRDRSLCKAFSKLMSSFKGPNAIS